MYKGIYIHLQKENIEKRGETLALTLQAILKMLGVLFVLNSVAKKP
jgi:hypothetical protein